MHVRLTVANTSSATKQIRLGAKTLIGRSPECNLRIASGLVSRRHCLIKVDQAVVTVRDLGSANGTRLNGEPVAAQSEVTISPGKPLGVGPLTFIVQFAAPKSKAEDDTEWLPRLPSEQTGHSEKAEKLPAKDVDTAIQSLVPPPSSDGEETKDLPASKRRRPAVPPNVVVSGAGTVGHDSGVPGPDALQGVDPGMQTVPDLAALARESVLDLPADADAGSPADPAAALKQKASQTHLVFEEEDLKQMNVASGSPSAPLADDSDSPLPDDGIDEELRKFLNDS